MSEWAFILTPLLVLPIVVLFRFVGCAQIAGLEKPPEERIVEQGMGPPKYKEYILGENPPGDPVQWPNAKPNKADVIAYWRLVEPRVSAGVAVDAKGFQNGEYRLSPGIPATAPGEFAPGQALIDSDPTATCRFFNGGYVYVPFKAGLYTEEFTIEAWILGSFQSGSARTLFHAGGHYVSSIQPGFSPQWHGFEIFADGNSWQVRLLGATANLFSKPPIIPPPPGRTHLAVMVEDNPDGTKKFTLYVDGTKNTEQANTGSYSRPVDAPLLIGVGVGSYGNTIEPITLANPIRSQIQEVVLHRKALSEQEIQNHVFINKKV